MRSEDVPIAGWKTGKDWKAFRKLLVIGGDTTKWDEAFEQYFFTRLTLRYLNPIRLLEAQRTFHGEGFSILAIQCTLIES